MISLKEIFGIQKHYRNQTEAIIETIEQNPGITRSELGQIRVNGFRIANVTARITDARRMLRKHGRIIECKEEKPIRRGKSLIRCTRYIIFSSASCSAV